jgi:hypothetical protein
VLLPVLYLRGVRSRSLQREAKAPGKYVSRRARSATGSMADITNSNNEVCIAPHKETSICPHFELYVLNLKSPSTCAPHRLSASFRSAKKSWR